MGLRDIARVTGAALVDQSDVRKMKDQCDNNDGEISDRQSSPEMELSPNGK